MCKPVFVKILFMLRTSLAQNKVIHTKLYRNKGIVTLHIANKLLAWGLGWSCVPPKELKTLWRRQELDNVSEQCSSETLKARRCAAKLVVLVKPGMRDAI